MGDPFFQSGSSGGPSTKRKRVRHGQQKTIDPLNRKPSDTKHRRDADEVRKRNKSKKKKKFSSEEGTESDGSEADLIASPDDLLPTSDEEDDPHETPAQKRLRLAQAYLNGLKRDQLREDGTFDAAEIDQEIISSRLQQDVLEASGKLHTILGPSLKMQFSSSSDPYKLYKTGKNHHRLPITCAKLSKDGSKLFVADKQGQIVCYDSAHLWSSSPDSSNSEPSIPRVLRKTMVLRNHVPSKKSNGKEKFDRKKKSGTLKTLADVPKEGAEEQKGHLGQIFTIDVSDDGKLLASGGKDKLVGVWDISEAGGCGSAGECKGWEAGLRGHKDIISSLAFRKGTSTIYTASYDRMIKVFNLDSLTYSETLFGHQDSIHSISSLSNETVVSAGSRDRTCRYWKIVDESQLVFRGGGRSKLRDLIDGAGLDDDDEQEGLPMKRKGRNIKENAAAGFVEGSVDCVCMIDETMFLSGGDSGSISLWTTHKKKAIFTYPLAHGTETKTVTDSPTETLIQPCWITSLSSLPYSDIFCSGSWDGQVKLWRLMKGERGSEMRKFELMGCVAVGLGLVNSLQLVLVGKKLGLVAGVAQEDRLGRWRKVKEAKNRCLAVVFDIK